MTARPWEIRRQRNIAKKIRAKKNKEIIAALELLLDAKYFPDKRVFFYNDRAADPKFIHRREVFPTPEYQDV